MKKFINIFAGLMVAFCLSNCNTDDQFTGTPVGNLNIVTLTGNVSPTVTENNVTTTTTSALSGQKFKFTATIPRTFNDTVTVEATTIAKSGGTTTASVDILPGQTSAVGEIGAVGGAIFETDFDLSLTAINLKQVEKGTHYLLTSNKVTIKTGNSTIPDSDPDKLIMRLLWENPSSANKLRYVINRPSPLTDAVVTTINSYGKVHYINKANGSNSSNISSAEGDYILNISADALPASPVDEPYRLIIVSPNGKVQVFEGVYNGLFVGAPLKPILKVTKTGTGASALFTATDVF